MGYSSEIFAGEWTYRSYLNNPDPAVDPNTLLFGFGILKIEEPSFGALAGTIGGTDWSLSLRGAIYYGNPMTIRFQGTGNVDGEPWIYDYHAFHAPVWPNGVNQQPAIIGTVVRTIAHSNGKATAGVTASWIAVRRV